MMKQLGLPQKEEFRRFLLLCLLVQLSHQLCNMLCPTEVVLEAIEKLMPVDPVSYTHLDVYKRQQYVKIH